MAAMDFAQLYNIVNIQFLNSNKLTNYMQVKVLINVDHIL